MKKISLFFLLMALAVLPTVKAQYMQNRPPVEYMFKFSAGYMPFVSNLGNPGENGYYINDLRHIVNANVINGINIRQDFFLGLGLGYGYVAPTDNFTTAGWHSAMVFADFDYRPIDQEWAPMVEAKVGAHYMMSDTPYENTLTPYIELSTGINWFFCYKVRNMERNYMSMFFELGFAYTQQTTFIPLRIGVRL